MVIALTGKCCSGKNYISSLLESEGFTVVDVDKVSHRVFGHCTDIIIETFGDAILTEGIIDRKKLGKCVFSNSKKREVLESIIHPLVYKEIYSTIDKNRSTDYLINIPLLTNRELIDRCDSVIWISSPFFLRFIRTLKRDRYSIITVIKRIFVQRKLSVKHLISVVDINIIRNSFSSRVLNRDIDTLVKKLRRGLNDR